jgi:hypothetical protein
MKTLLESILDDEDVLISNAIKNSNNPFYGIFELYKNRNSLLPYRSEILNLLKDYGVFLSVSSFWVIGERFISMRTANKTVIEPIYFKFSDKNIYLCVDIDKRRLNNTLKQFGVKYEDFQKFIKYIIKKFEFKNTNVVINRFQQYSLFK